MRSHRAAPVVAITGLLLAFPCASPARQGDLETVRVINCEFPLMAVGTWSEEIDGTTSAEVRPSELVLEFEDINADEATAQLASDYGNYDIIVRYAEGYLHFIQSFLDGPLHVTTVYESEAGPGKLKAMHSRHEYTAFALPGFTSSPEQYYGACEILE